MAIMALNAAGEREIFNWQREYTREYIKTVKEAHAALLSPHPLSSKRYIIALKANQMPLIIGKLP